MTAATRSDAAAAISAATLVDVAAVTVNTAVSGRRAPVWKVGLSGKIVSLSVESVARIALTASMIALPTTVARTTRATMQLQIKSNSHSRKSEPVHSYTQRSHKRSEEH